MITVDNKTTPMMTQWQECKNQAPNAILFFRLGDFYEAFYEDALICAKELDLTLTKRQQVPMSGVPYHAVDTYIDKLIIQGYKVAIAEQVEDPKETKGLVKREIVRIITPGTLINSSLIGEKTHNYFASITLIGNRIGLAFVDLTCADCKVIELDTVEDALLELYRFKPTEILTSSKTQDKYPELFKEVQQHLKCMIDCIEEWRFDHQLTYGFLTQTFKVHSLDGFGLKGMVAAINAVGALLAYTQDVLFQPLGPLTTIIPYSKDAFMGLDKSTMRNLELVEPLHAETKSSTLLKVIDHTLTPMGGRLIRSWLLHPLLDLDMIKSRQTSVAELLTHPILLDKLRKSLTPIRDLQRLITKIAQANASPRDYQMLKCSLVPIREIKDILENFSSNIFQNEKNHLDPLTELIQLIDHAIVEEPPFRLSDGGVFKMHYNSELDELRGASLASKTWMADYQTQIREDTGIKTAKVGYSKVAGFFIEVSKGQAGKMPEFFQRKQTLTNSERFLTPVLKAYEEKILTAEERITQIEAALFQELKEKVTSYSQAILENAQALAIIDTLQSLAWTAKCHRYIKPEMEDSTILEIVEGRHPVIESALMSEKFISNDTCLDGQQEKMMIITGPNMAGKSTYIRQVALIAILAHMGSFIPAKSARIGIIDKVFTRIGASDDLTRGQSTFMVEMTETAYILHQTTSRSLVILDEIGRGTSTYDGISLAWSIAEYLLKTPGKTPKTLFATHYWELTKLEEKVPGAINYNVAVYENGDTILFLRKILKGGTDKSYGIHVAQLAGIPRTVLTRAREILQYLEQSALQKNIFDATKNKKTPSRMKENSSAIQLGLKIFD